jgi:lipoprotein-releasing system permease protein
VLLLIKIESKERYVDWLTVGGGGDGTVMFALQFDTELLIQTLVLATITGLLSAFAPALRAARLDPVVAIRG